MKGIHAVFLVLILASLTSVANGQSSPTFTDISVFGGATAKPNVGATFGFTIGAGSGKNLIDAEYAQDNLGNYSLGGRGKSYLACTDGCPIPPFEVTFSDAAATRLTGNYSRSLYSNPRFALYATGGAGYLKTRWTGTLNCGACVPADYSSATIYYHSSAFVGQFGAGVRVPVIGKGGVRLEVKEWVNKPGDFTIKNHVVEINLAVYYRWFTAL